MTQPPDTFTLHCAIRFFHSCAKDKREVIDGTRQPTAAEQFASEEWLKGYASAMENAALYLTLNRPTHEDGSSRNQGEE